MASDITKTVVLFKKNKKTKLIQQMQERMAQVVRTSSTPNPNRKDGLHESLPVQHPSK